MNERLLREWISIMLAEQMSGADIADRGANYEIKLVKDLEAAGVKTGGVAGFTSAADVTAFTAEGEPFGIEAKASVAADMGSASLGYDAASGTITISDKVKSKNPIGAEVAKRLDIINSNTELMDKIQALGDAGFIKPSSYKELKNWSLESGYPMLPTVTIRIGESDLIAKHYQSKGETAEYIQIQGWGLYLLSSNNDPLGLSGFGALPLSAPISITVGARQRGSRTRDDSRIGIRAQARVLTGDLEKSGLDLDTPSGISNLKSALGYNEAAIAESLIRRIASQFILSEELTKADVEKITKAQIEKDRAEQKRIIKKEIESELKSSLGTSFFGNPGKVRKAVEEIVQDELSREFGRSGKMKDQVADITKAVLKKMYREISHSYNPVIDRIRI